MGLKTIRVENLAQAYLELLNDRGIDYFFANAGTDFAPLIDAFAFFAKEGKSVPKPVTVAHENVAVAMAHGRYLVTAKPQVVMVHVNVGTANAINGIINAAREHIPIIFTAGRTPLTEAGCPGSRNLYIHWSQETFDQASMVREYVKWDYELRNFTQLEAVVDRATGNRHGRTTRSGVSYTSTGNTWPALNPNSPSLLPHAAIRETVYIQIRNPLKPLQP
jgi:acetolactate synthase I/II/III large subunit